MRLMFSLVFAAYMSSCAHYSPVVNNTNINEIDFTDIGKWKRGVACSDYVLCLLGPIRGERNSLSDAIKDGGLSRVYLVEQKFTWFLLLCQHCTIAYGTTKKPDAQ